MTMSNMLPFGNYNVSSRTKRDPKNSNSNKRRRKKRRPAAKVVGGGGGDDLAAVKAAAWAWYQRNEGKPMTREFDLSKASSRITPRPSRYKLEATKNMILSENRVSKSSLCPTASIYHDHDYGDDGHGFVEREFSHDDHRSHGKVNGFVKKVNKGKLWGRLMLMGPATVCGRSDDVDLRASRSGRKTGKVAAAAAAVALVRSTARGK
ncbi:PREDICTED: uncharacterized protein LOC104822277 [Tarenaya hassleriana]|uniref:uncharacterized protein LOC104822277 n=1 Tax=Tarenaya hassleriana TaxID=28532 RepID=UPI00053C77AC|nr:PREDICTED: uncharacterized protein LOC104822277 [Tarenaya hassleriana]